MNVMEKALPCLLLLVTGTQITLPGINKRIDYRRDKFPVLIPQVQLPYIIVVINGSLIAVFFEAIREIR